MHSGPDPELEELMRPMLERARESARRRAYEVIAQSTPRPLPEPRAVADRVRQLPHCRRDLVDALAALVAGRVIEDDPAMPTVDGDPTTAAALNDLFFAHLARVNPAAPHRWEPTVLGVQVDALWAVRAHRVGVTPTPAHLTR